MWPSSEQRDISVTFPCHILKKSSQSSSLWLPRKEQAQMWPWPGHADKSNTLWKGTKTGETRGAGWSPGKSSSSTDDPSLPLVAYERSKLPIWEPLCIWVSYSSMVCNSLCDLGYFSGSHFVEVKVAQSDSLWLHELNSPWILQDRILEWAAVPFSRGSSQPRDQTQVSYTAGGFFTSWAIREAEEYWSG